jgi:hypothetical protein
MKLNILGVLLSLALLCVLAFSVSAPAALNGSTGTSLTAASLPATANPAPAEQHPQIRDAIAALRNARAHLEHAAHDFGGHRVEAIKATDEAIHQLEICLKYDKD